MLFRYDSSTVREKWRRSELRANLHPELLPSGKFVVALVLWLSMIATVLSCAYYNTFYFARQYYQQAMRVAEQPRRTTTAVPPQVSSLLDKSIEKCAKVISLYPESKWVDDAIFLMGSCYYNKHEYNKAIQKFNELTMYYPASKLVPEALFMAGMCYFGKKEYDQSSQIMLKVLREYPKLKHRERALFTLGEASFEKKNYVEALPHYKLLAGKRKNSKLYFESLLRIGSCYFELARYDSARISLSTVVRSSPDDEQALEALIKIGDSYASEGSFDAATQNYEKALDLAKDFDMTPVVRLKIASVTAATGEYEKAIELYRSLVEEFPRTTHASEAQFRIGYIYEVYTEDLESAKLAYDRVKDHSPRSEFASQAAIRSKGLAKLKEFSQVAERAETQEAAKSAFLMAELCLFQLGKPDKAIEKYLSVEREFPMTSYAPKSAYAAAYVFMNVKSDTALAVEKYMKILKSFPNTEYAVAAREILEALGIETPEERVFGPVLEGVEEGKKGLEEEVLGPFPPEEVGGKERKPEEGEDAVRNRTH